MGPYYELAYALESKSLCLFVGTGFSMHITDGKAPSWLNLLKTCVKELEGNSELNEQLFPNNKPIMPLEECASIIQAKIRSSDKCLHTQIAKIIEKIKISSHADKVKIFLEQFPNLKFITTNYDLLIEQELLSRDKVTSYAIGYPINRQPNGIQVYHIHGSIRYPKKMVVTADDYFNFINSPDYFSKKVQTLIEENTTVIMGYSLGDVNFKSILNKLRANRTHDINRQHLFFLSRSKIDNHIKDYYDRSYGLRVIDNTDIDSFITRIVDKHDEIKDRVLKSKDLLFPVLEGHKEFTDYDLKKSDSFFEIIATLSSNGIIVSHPSVIKCLNNIFERKNALSKEDNAWNQYEHLAQWLVHIGSIMDIRNTALQITFLDAVVTSFSKMSKSKKLGKSWNAFNIWKHNWFDLTYDNRILIAELYDENIENKLVLTGDIKEVIEQ